MRLTKRAPILAVLATATVLASFLTSDAGSASPTDNIFNVELVVFRYNGAVASPESWDVTPPPGTAALTAQPADSNQADASAQPDIIRPLNPAQFQLSGTEAALRRNASYLPLAHFGFRLVAGDREAGTPVHIETMVDAASGLTGTVTLERGRFLHLAVDLTYTTANPLPALLPPNTQPAPVAFQMHQDRRMRPFERHYFDHPAFGVVAIITPVTPAGGND
jgi:hypothetical protein